MTVLLAIGHGHWMSKGDRSAILHLWRYIAYLVGVNPELVAANEADQWRLVTTQFNHQIRLDDVPRKSGRQLGRALIDSYPDLFQLNVKSPRDRRRLAAIVRENTLLMHLMLGEHAATTLGFDDPRISSIVPVARRALVNGTRRAIAYRLPGGRRRYEDAQRAAGMAQLLHADTRLQADLTYSRTGE